ncbi:T9SS type A sorting domain-containing protein [Salinivirga cyanobacteriivorans]
MRRFFIFLAGLLFSLNTLAQGTLMLVGGGTERTGDDAWNFDPYTKAVTLAGNSRVAIVAWGPEPDSWMRDYFTNTCNAADAKHFDLSAVDPADYPVVYDSLMTYDMFFFKGGDQYNYYSNFNNNEIEQAIMDKYAEGGVISGTSAGMAILSSIIFTAENGTVYPDESLNNPLNSYMALADDFVDLMPGYLFDTHFAERGRFPRLVGMLANWYETQSESRITGLGVDDLSAMIIRNDSVYAYGTGAGNFYDVANTQFNTAQTTVVADDIKVMQLLNGCTYDMNTGAVEGFEQFSEPALSGEGGDYTVLLGGGVYGSFHTDMMDVLVNECGSVNDNVLLVTGENSVNASALVTAIENHTSATVYQFAATTANGDDQTFSDAISDAGKVVFVDNAYATLMDFMNNTANGNQLNEKIRTHGGVVAFVGDNSRFAAHTVVNNYLESGASYYGTLSFDPGLNLLKTSVVMPQTFKNSDVYENTTTAVPYAMLLEDLTYGIWLNKRNYAKYYVNNDSTWLDGYGTSPVMAIKNNGTAFGFSVTPNVGNYDPRMVAGFEEMTLSVFDSTQTYLMGTEPGLGVEKTENEIQGKIYPNPANNHVFCDFGQPVNLQIYASDGKLIERYSGQKRYRISVKNYSAGMYLFRATTRHYTSTSKVSIR